jgi:hypothetical protein
LYCQANSVVCVGGKGVVANTTTEDPRLE